MVKVGFEEVIYMKKRSLIIAISVLVIALVAVLFVMNMPYKPTSFVVDGEIFSATVVDGGTLILDLDNSNESKDWSIASEPETFASDYHNITENIAEFHIIALNDGKGEMIFQCTNDDGTTDKYILALSISRHQKIHLQIDTVSFTEIK